MVGILSQGRLGNQMFQYAFIYAASKKLNTPFFIINHNSLHYFKLHQNLQKNNTKNTFKYAALNFFKKSSIKLSRKTARTPIIWLKNWATYKNIYTWRNTTYGENYLLPCINNNILFDGFFQSEDYFVHLKEEILQQFEIKPVYQQQFKSLKKHIFVKEVIALHIRRSDYIFFGNDDIGGINVALPIDYYKKSLSLIKNKENYNIIFISDDIEFVKNEFGNNFNYYYENNSEIIDFQLLMNANILIIANSTFSWWAAWLNKKDDKIIYAPNYFLGFKIKKFYPAGIKVSNWKWIDVIS